MPQQIGATHYLFRQPDSGYQNRSISHSFHFMGKVCDLDGRHMTVSENFISLCHASCSAVGRFPEPFTQYPWWGDADTDRQMITIWEAWMAGRREKQRSRMQGCKNAKTKIFCILALLNEKQQQKERISFACKRVNGLNETYPACRKSFMTRKTAHVFTRAILRYTRKYTPTRRMWL